MSPIPSKKALVIAGLHVNVYSLPTTTPERPVAILFFLHGRTRSTQDMEPHTFALYEELQRKNAAAPAPAAQDLVVVTFDLRNHGTRLVSDLANLDWATARDVNNDRHAIDMYAVETGSAHDVSFLIDFLPAYLFPDGERTIAQWLIAGISLGGHVAWLVLKNEPRVRLGVPIIGCPDYLALLSARAKASGIPVAPPYFPNALLSLIGREDPVNAPYTAADASNPFLGKKVLVLCGADDVLVPAAFSRGFVEKLAVGERGVKEMIVEPGVGHSTSPRMIKETARFLWEHALTVAA